MIINLDQLVGCVVKSMLELYRLPGCPYCVKVERKLDELGLSVTIHNVSPFRTRRTEVERISGQTNVPVLVDTEHGITGIAESSDIIAHLERTYSRN